MRWSKAVCQSRNMRQPCALMGRRLFKRSGETCRASWPQGRGKQNMNQRELNLGRRSSTVRSVRYAPHTILPHILDGECRQSITSRSSVSVRTREWYDLNGVAIIRSASELTPPRSDTTKLPPVANKLPHALSNDVSPAETVFDLMLVASSTRGQRRQVRALAAVGLSQRRCLRFVETERCRSRKLGWPRFRVFLVALVIILRKLIGEFCRSTTTSVASSVRSSLQTFDYSIYLRPIAPLFSRTRVTIAAASAAERISDPR